MNLIKKLACILAFGLSIQVVQCALSPLLLAAEKVKIDEKNFENSIQGKAPFFVMTIVRDAQSVMLPSERMCIENIIELLCGNISQKEDDTLSEVIQNDQKHIKDIKGKKAEEYINDIYANYELSVYNKDIDSIQNSYNGVKKSIKDYIKNTDIKAFSDGCGIIVLNEMFFGKEAPYPPEEYEKVLKEFSTLSKLISSKLLCINVLANKEYEGLDSQKELLKRLNTRRFVRNDTKFDPLDENDASLQKAQYIEKAYKRDKTIALENASHAFLAGQDVFTYNKASYFGECDDQLDKNIPYIFGDGKIKFFSNFNWLGQYISIQICRDLVCGIGIPESPNKIHIFQSNSLGLYQGVLPNNAKSIIHADPYLSISNCDFYCHKMIFDLDEENYKHLRWENGGKLVFALKFNLNKAWYHIFVREVRADIS